MNGVPSGPKSSGRPTNCQEENIVSKEAKERVDDICMLAAAQIVATARGPKLRTLDSETMERLAVETIRLARAIEIARHNG